MNKKRAVGLFLALILLFIFVQAESSITRGSASGTSFNRCDLVQFPITDIAGDQYAYGCLSETQAKSCRKSDGVTITESFKIPGGNILLQRCGAGSTPNILASCANPQHCREIDEVWKTIGPLVRGSTDIWDVLEKVWKAFSVLYPSAQPSIIYSPPRGPGAFDEIITIAADSNDVEPALLKAIIKHESSFDPDEISRTGCVGLMQICTTSAKFPHITKMSGQTLTSSSSSELKNINSCCSWDKNTESYRCQKEYEACGNNKWCPTGGYRCDPHNDDRFDPRKNILSGAATLKAKMDSIQKQENECGIHCQIAAYNIGEGVVNAAIEAATPDATLPLSWDDVYAKITPELMERRGYTGEEGWTESERQKKRENLDGYVKGIVKSYEEYKSQLVASR